MNQTVIGGKSPRLGNYLRWILIGTVVVALLYAFPPFRIMPLKASSGGKDSAGAIAFDAIDFARQFWGSRLQPAAVNAVSLTPLLADLGAHPLLAAKRYGHQVGVDGPAFYFVSGEGRIVAIERGRVVVAIDGANGATVALRRGPVFGNVIRDGTGLIDVNSVPGLAEFNAVSSELNRIVEERVLPLLNNVAVGSKLRFTGCAEAPETVAEGPLLQIVPVKLEVLR